MKANTITFSLATVLCLFPACSAWGKVIYVDDDAPTGGDGTSWTTAYRFLQDGLAGAEAGDEIKVAQGLYRPDRSSQTPEGSGDREASFVLPEGMSVKGGFAGLTGAEPNAWNVSLYETVLSGDLGGNDTVLDDPAEFRDDPSREDNSMSVVMPGASTVLGGLTITAGHAQPRKCSGPNCPDMVPMPGYYGGGVLIEANDITLRNCRIHRNFSEMSGGGIFAGALRHEVRRFSLDDCVLERNGAYRFGGGGLCVHEGTAKIKGCEFLLNWGQSEGGGVRSWKSEITISDCVVRCNKALQGGGGLRISLGNVYIENTLIEKNEAGDSGGGGYFDKYVEIRQCRFIGNRSSFGGAVINYGGLLSESSLYCGNVARTRGGALYSTQSQSLVVKNCTFAGNSAITGQSLAVVTQSSSPVAISNCIVSDGDEDIYTYKARVTLEYTAVGVDSSVLDSAAIVRGQGNLEVDPCFADPGCWDANDMPDDPNDDFFVEGDYHLKSQAGRWDLNSGSWVRDDVTSPCIDAGDPNSPIGYEPFPNGGRINMGAYGGTVEASKSYFGQPVSETIIAGDINGDGKVDWLDLDILSSHWLQDAGK